MDLECSNDGLDLNESRSPPRRRRSTFFEKRETLVPQLEPETRDDCQTETATEDDRKQQYLRDIARYYDKLSKEKEAWKYETRQRRLQYSDMKSQLKVAAAGPQSSSIDYSVLTNEDIDFLKAKPNITKIAESALELKQQLSITMYMMKRLKDLNEDVLSHCEGKVSSVQRYVMENSVIEPTEE